MVLMVIGCDDRPIAQATAIDRADLQELLAKETNQVQVINFWATWCAPCVEELPAFEKLGSNYQDEVKVTLISLDEEAVLEEKVNPFLIEHEIKSEVVVLDDPYAAEWIPMIDDHWDGAIPVTLIQANGKKRFYNQSFTYDELENALKEFL